MAYQVAVKRSAAKQAKALPASVRPRVRDAIYALATEPRPQGVKTLNSAKKLYRIRVGQYRVVYQIQDRQLVVLVVRVAHRKEVYRQLDALVGRTPPP